MNDRALPSVGFAVRVRRFLSDKYAVSVKDLAEAFRISMSSAKRYTKRLDRTGFIYPRYRIDKRVYYSLVRKQADEAGKTN
jgi:Mn-dependent DtxR family transcriptional regulator